MVRRRLLRRARTQLDAVRLGRASQSGATSEPRSRLAPWFLVAAFVALVGGFVDADYRAWIWLASLVIDVVGTLTVARAEWMCRRHTSPSASR